MIKCIAIDDEPVALGIITEYCKRYGDISLETYTSPHEAMRRVEEWQPDIVLLDIELNGTSGLRLAARLPSTCCLVFTTAYAQYALDGFEANAVDFLHKPFFYDRFCRAMQKARQWLRMRDLLRQAESGDRQLMLKADYKNVAVPLDAILYIESVDNYVKVHQSGGATVLSKIPLHRVESQLPEGEFLRIHRSFIVPRNKVSGFTRTEVSLHALPRPLPVGRKYAAAVLAALGAAPGE